MKLDESSNIINTNIVGRPEVFGSAIKQMRHVTPFSFIEEIIKAENKGINFSTKISWLSSNIVMFIPQKSGLRLTDEQYELLEFKDDIKPFKINTTKDKEDTVKTTYLVEKEILPPNWKELIGFNTSEQKVIDAEKNYAKTMEKFIKYSIGVVLDNQDLNTQNIICEALSELLLTLYNIQEDIAFPNEGNTLPYEIRLYKSDVDALNCKEFIPVTSDYIEIKAHEGVLNINNKIRISQSEGYITRDTLKLLRLLNVILRDFDPDDEFAIPNGNQRKNIEEYNEKNTLKLPLTKSTDVEFMKQNYPEGISQSPTYPEYAKHIAKLLY